MGVEKPGLSDDTCGSINDAYSIKPRKRDRRLGGWGEKGKRQTTISLVSNGKRQKAKRQNFPRQRGEKELSLVLPQGSKVGQQTFVWF